MTVNGSQEVVDHLLSVQMASTEPTEGTCPEPAAGTSPVPAPKEALNILPRSR